MGVGASYAPGVSRDLVIGVGGGLVATALWAFPVYPAVLVGLRWHRYRGLEGRFRARLRSTNEIHWLLEIKRDGTVFV